VKDGVDDVVEVIGGFDLNGLCAFAVVAQDSGYLISTMLPTAASMAS
jgi:hypothetical protein